MIKRDKLGRIVKGNTPWNKGIKGVITSWNKGVKGYSTSWKGRKHTLDAKRKMSEAKKGKRLSEEHKKKISLAQEGEKNHNYGRKHTEEIRKIMSLFAKKRFENKLNHPSYGQKLSEITKDKIRKARMKQTPSAHHTKPELKFMGLIKKYNLPYKYVGDGKFWIENINPDFINCNGEKIVIEIFGDYWHNPKQRKGLKFFQTEEGRKQILAKYSWKCIIIWEHELEQLSDDEILKKIGVL